MDERRTPLTRDRALTAALALADEDGLDALSMRALAARLGVSPMALYKHLAGKDELLGGMVDAVVAGYDPEPAEGWKPSVRAHVLAARRALDAHPWLRRLIESRDTPTPAVLAHMDAVAGVLIDGGLSVELAHHAMHALGHRIWGFSPEAFATSGPPPADPVEREAAGRAMAQAYPHVVAIAMDAVSHDPTGACDEDAEFAFTLDLLLDAFERLHESGWTSRAR